MLQLDMHELETESEARKEALAGEAGTVGGASEGPDAQNQLGGLVLDCRRFAEGRLSR